MQSQQTMLYLQPLLANPILYLQALLANPRLYLHALLANPCLYLQALLANPILYLQALLANPYPAGIVQAAGSGGGAPCGSGGPGLVGPAVACPIARCLCLQGILRSRGTSSLQVTQQSVAVASHADRQLE